MSRRAGCGNSARPDLWEPRGSNPLGRPDQGCCRYPKLSKPTVKQPLAAIRMMFDWMVTRWMVTRGVLGVNPASAVRGPKYVIKKGKTPVLTPEEARLLLDSIPLVRKTRPAVGMAVSQRRNLALPVSGIVPCSL